jgi:YD repeat-containing protein
VPRLRQHRIVTQAAVTDVFQVDSDGRITAENTIVPNVTLSTGEIANSDVAAYIGVGNNWCDYTLDNIGNIRQREMKNQTLVHTVDALSRLTALGGRQQQLFTFDQFTGLLAMATGAASTSTFTYDALGRRRIEHRTGDYQDHIYVWDGHHLVAHGTASNMTLDVGGDDIDAHVVSIDTNGTGARWFYHQGPDQSVIAVTGSTGFIEAYTYSAFGELTAWSATAARSQPLLNNVFQYHGGRERRAGWGCRRPDREHEIVAGVDASGNSTERVDPD